MKRIFHIFVSFFISLLVLMLPLSSVKASPTREEVELSPLEKDIRDALLADGDADLAELESADQRVVPATSIVRLWKDPNLQGIPFFKIRNAIIEDDIQADGISIPFNVEFHTSIFNGRIELSNATVISFRIQDSVVRGAVRMGRMSTQGDLALYNTTFESAVVLFAADIGGSLLGNSSKFNGVAADPGTSAPLELWKIQVGQATEFTGAVIKGETKADDAKFNVDARFNQVTFEQDASFTAVKVGTIADFRGTKFMASANFEGSTFGLDAYFREASFNGVATFANTRVENKADFQKAVFEDEVSFESSIMNRDVAFTEAVFNGTANFDYLTVNRFFDFNQTTLNQRFSIQYPTIGWPYFEEAAFNGPVNFEGMQASNEIDFTDATYNYLNDPFTVTLARVDGAAKFDGFTAPSGLSLEHNQFGDLNISGKEDKSFSFIDLDSTTVNGDLTMQNVDTFKLSAEGLSVKDSTTFSEIAIEKELNMSNASLGFFTIDEKGFWPRSPGSTNNLRGMTYTDIGLVGNELEDDTWEVLLDMVQESDYSPQAYYTLSQFLTEKGHSDWAADVELKRKIRERDHILKDQNTGAWLWSWFLYLFSGYGQIPALALVWSALVIAIGAILYWRESDLVVLDNSPAKPVYDPFLYSFAVFVPFIELDIAEKWDPDPKRRAAWLYKYILKILGWILTPIALLTFGGIIK